jgi:DNA-binding NarL/FixJ family response regulator
VIKIILVDDQQLFLDSLSIVIESRAEDIRVVGTAKNGRDALELIRERQPHIAVLDVRMPVMDGVECSRRIHSEFPNVHIMMLTTFDDDRYVHQALTHGATGYMLKDIPPDELIAAIRAIYSGAVSVSPSIMAKLVSEAMHGVRDKLHSIRDDYTEEMLSTLSDREHQILDLIGAGYTNSQIAERVYLAEQTVKNYISVVYQKIHAENRIEAIGIINALKAGNPGDINSTDSSPPNL